MVMVMGSFDLQGEGTEDEGSVTAHPRCTFHGGKEKLMHEIF